MSGLFLVPVDDDWIERFERTVEKPVSINPEDAPEPLQDFEEARIWGTTDEGRKRAYFEQMENGDPLLFYNSGRYFAVGRVGNTFEDEAIGEWLWNKPESSFIFTVTNFHRTELTVEEINEILGYKENNIPMGFNRPSESAISNLLQYYNSVEEAFQDFKTGDLTGPQDTEEGKTQVETDSREHTEIQWHLVQLGLNQGYDVYVARNDQNREYNSQPLGEECVDSLNLTGFSKSAMNIIEYVDVIWLEDDYIVEMFEVESTTSIYSGILRMTDFVVKVPNLAVNMNIVAPEADADKVRREMNRPTFEQILSRSDHSTLNFISFEDVRERHDIVQTAGPLQQVF